MDLQEAFDAGFGAVKEYVDRSFASFEKRLVTMERRLDSTKDATIGDLRKDIDGLRASVDALPEPVDVAELIKRATASLATPAELRALIAEDLAAIQDARIAPLVGEAVERAVAGLPVPENGKDADPEKVAALVEQTVEAAIARLPKAKDGNDGLGMAGSMIDRDGNLVVTMTDGTARTLGRVVGKDVDMIVVEGMVDAATHKAIAGAVAALPRPKDGDPGKSVTVDDVAPMIRAEIDKAAEKLGKLIPKAVQDAVSTIPPAPAGKDADPAVIQRMVDEAVAKIPPAKDGEPGKSVELWQVTAMVAGQVKAAVDELPKPRDGQDVDPDVVKATIAEEVHKAVAALPAPKDGHTPTVEEYGPVIEGAVRKAVAALPVAKDGVGVAGALIDNKGALVLTLSDGTTRDLGKIVGRDGDDADMVAVEQRIKELFDAWPKPKDGADGIGFDDVQQEIEDEGRFIVQRWLKDGVVVREIRLQTRNAIWRGVYTPTKTYLPGDLATWKGSVWHCNKEVTGKIGSEFWSLAVKKGRDAPEGGQA